VKTRKFVDSVVIHAAAGNGGNGCVSFRREKYVPRGGPDGGDGGDGGSVILRADPEVDSLIAFHYSPIQRAANAGHGSGQRKHGRSGGDLVLRVPPGTVICENASGRLIGELTEPGQDITVARGGRGGRGNWQWRSPTHRTPTEHTDGEPGEEIDLKLDLKLVSDVGLIGFPNAGKSSLLRAISHAHPKVAAYPFTTLNPIIGTVVFDDYSRMRVADIPGLIEGAHEGVGLGDAFLRHVERAVCLVFVIDTAGIDGRCPYEDFRCLREEIRRYNDDLCRRPYIVAANKMDLPRARENIEIFRRETGQSPIPISAKTGDGIDALKQAMQEMWRKRGDSIKP